MGISTQLKVVYLFWGFNNIVFIHPKNRKSFWEYIINIHNRVSKFFYCIYNNQKGYLLKYQRYGTSNEFVKVTGSVIKRFIHVQMDTNFFTKVLPLLPLINKFQLLQILQHLNQILMVSNLSIDTTKSTSRVGGWNTLFLMGLRRACPTKSHQK